MKREVISDQFLATKKATTKSLNVPRGGASLTTLSQKQLSIVILFIQMTRTKMFQWFQSWQRGFGELMILILAQRREFVGTPSPIYQSDGVNLWPLRKTHSLFQEPGLYHLLTPWSNRDETRYWIWSKAFDNLHRRWRILNNDPVKGNGKKCF